MDGGCIPIVDDPPPGAKSPPTNRYPTHFRTPDNESIYGKAKNAIFQKVNNSNKSPDPIKGRV